MTKYQCVTFPTFKEMKNKREHKERHDRQIIFVTKFMPKIFRDKLRRWFDVREM